MAVSRTFNGSKPAQTTVIRRFLAHVRYTSTWFLVQDIDGRNTKMNKYKGKVVLAVNVASQCGFTKQYKVRNGYTMTIWTNIDFVSLCQLVCGHAGAR